MSDHDRDDGGLALLSRPSALSRLLSVSVVEFADRHWGRRALLSSSTDLPRDFADLLDDSSIDELVSERGLRTPFLRVAKNGTTLADKSFTAPGGVGATIADQISDDKLVRLFAEGSTMVLQALHRVWPPIIGFCQQLAADLGHPVQANAYVTPPQSRGFSDHYDVHDVFVLQLTGEKRWTIHAPVHDAPLRSEPWTDRRTAVERRAAEPALIDAVLRPGDCLYLPRGFLHAATALGGVSAHLTLGVHTWTRYGLAEKLVAEALRDAARRTDLRTSLPLGVTLSEPASWTADVDVVREALVQVIRELPPERLASALQADERAAQRAAPIGPLQQLRSAHQLTGRETIELRAHLAASLDFRTDGSATLRSRAGDLTVAADELPALRTLLAHGSSFAADLGLDLARRLLLAGLATAA